MYNHTKGGKPRTFHYAPEAQEFMTALKHSPDIQPTGHIFADRLGIAKSGADACAPGLRGIGHPYTGHAMAIARLSA